MLDDFYNQFFMPSYKLLTVRLEHGSFRCNWTLISKPIQKRRMSSTGNDERKSEISIPTVNDKDETSRSHTELNRNKRNAECQCYGSTQRMDPHYPLHNTTDSRFGCCSAICRRLGIPQTINWSSLLNFSRKWVKHPMNMGLLVWLVFVTTGLIVLFLLVTGLIIKNDTQRQWWTEVDNQALNALYTIMCLYQHPKLFHHIVLLIRWAPADIIESRKAYCKGPAQRSYERAHIAIVVSLLHVTCFSQYALCSIYWGFTSQTRPAWADTLFNVIGYASPVIAGTYTFFSPLGRRYEGAAETEPEPEVGLEPKLDRSLVTSPKWAGGLFGFHDDVGVACMSIFCTCCVFGWNMERLGLGSMYVHIITFAVFVISPVWVFYVSALNIDDGPVRWMVEIGGFLLCFLGLLYGGFWRVQMRKRFKLPGSSFCCGNATVTDFVQWLFCWGCSLAQEVRTGSFYDIAEEGFYVAGDGAGTFSSVSTVTAKESFDSFCVSIEEGFYVKGAGTAQVSSVSMVTGKESFDSFCVIVEGETTMQGEAYLMTPPMLLQIGTTQEGKN